MRTTMGQLPQIFALVGVLLFSSIVQTQSRQETFRPPVRGTRGVVAGGHPLVTEAGLRMLHRGGNAVDGGVVVS